MQTQTHAILSKKQFLIYQLVHKGFTVQQIAVTTKLSVLTITLTIKKLKKVGY